MLEKEKLPKLTIFFSFSVPASGLSNLRVSIPETTHRGSDVIFNCSFNLQDEKLYAVKWYRGTYEIFRYLPSETPNIKTFPLEGFHINVSKNIVTFEF